VVGERNITEFNYRLSDREHAYIFVGIAIHGDEERKAFSEQLTTHGFVNIDLTDNELAKTHLRYMVGGRSHNVRGERLFRFWFPERPGAMARFLATMGADWNISLFHYRIQGGDFGRVLVGLEIPSGQERHLQTFLDNLGYRHVEESDNEAYRLFL
jgi:threonine dehydratase